MNFHEAKMYPFLSEAGINCYSVEEVSALRKRLFTRLVDFRKATAEKGEKLQEVRKFRYFEEEMDHFMSILDDLFDAVPEEDPEELTNIQAKICKHEDMDSEFIALESERNYLEQIGLEMITEDHTETEVIRKKICDMKKNWHILSSKLTDQLEILRTKQHFIEFRRNYDIFISWIEAEVEFFSNDPRFDKLDELESYVHQFTRKEKEVFRKEVEAEELRATADFFIKDDSPQGYQVSQRKENLNQYWQSLKTVIQEKKPQFHELIRFHKLCCRVEELLSWISRKKASIIHGDYGKDLTEIVVLLSKADGIQSILEEVEPRYDDIIEEYDNLTPLRLRMITGIIVDETVIEQSWLELTTEVEEYRKKLNEYYIIYKIKSDIDNMVSWMNELKSIFPSEDTSEKIADGEATLSMLNIYKNVIDSRKDMLDEIVETGGQLMSASQEHSAEISRKLCELHRAKESLHELFESQQQKYQERMEYQLLQREYDIIENWLEKKETFLYMNKDQLTCLDEIDELLVEQGDFETMYVYELRKIELIAEEYAMQEETTDDDEQPDLRKKAECVMNYSDKLTKPCLLQNVLFSDPILS